MAARARHVPLRRCTSCRRSRPQAELLRFYPRDGVWHLDAARRAGGRGSWLCADTPSCWELKKLRRTFRSQAEAVRALVQAAVSDPHGAQTEAPHTDNTHDPEGNRPSPQSL